MMLMRFFLAAFALASSASFVACSSVECESPKDCLDPLTCVDNKCVMNMGGGGGGPRDGGDAGPDMGIRADGGDAETEPADGGDASEPADGGDAGPDTGAPMIPDGGRLVYDSGTDGGQPTIVTLISGGTIIYGELNGNGEEVTEFAEMLDRSAASYAVLTRSFMDDNLNACTVTTTRFSSGTTIGYGADHIEVARFNNPSITRIYSPVAGRPGVFVGAEPYEGRLLQTPGEVHARVVSSEVAGTLDDADTELGRPVGSADTIMPTPGTALSLLVNNPTFAWLSPQTLDDLIVEAYDVNREVVLRCRVPSVITTYTIPIAAVRAFYSEGPQLPVYLEMSYHLERTIDVGIVGASQAVPVLVRSQRGVRYPLQ